MKTLFPYIIAASLLQSCTNNGQCFEISIYGKECNNLAIKLCRDTDLGLVTIDSTIFEMQKATLKGSVDNPELMYIFIDNANDYMPIFMENTEITVDANYEKPSKSIVTGSESHRIFTDFLQSYAIYSDKISGLVKSARNAMSNYDTAMYNKIDEERKLTDLEAKEFQKLFVQKNITHPIACYILSTHLMYTLSSEELKKILNSIPQENRNNKYYKKATEYLQQTSHKI